MRSLTTRSGAGREEHRVHVGDVFGWGWNSCTSGYLFCVSDDELIRFVEAGSGAMED